MTLCLGRPNTPRPSDFKFDQANSYPVLITFERTGTEVVSVSGKINTLTDRQLTLDNNRQFALGPETTFLRTVDGKEVPVTLGDVRDDEYAHVELQFPFDGPVRQVRLTKTLPAESTSEVSPARKESQASRIARLGKSVVTVFGTAGNPEAGGQRVRVHRHGVLIDPRGYVLTAGSLTDLKELRVTFDAYTSLPARFVAEDAALRVALLKVDSADPLPAADWGPQVARGAELPLIYEKQRDPRSLPFKVLAVNQTAEWGGQTYNGLLQIAIPSNFYEEALPIFQGDGLVGLTMLNKTVDGASLSYAQPAEPLRKFVEAALRSETNNK